LSYQSVNSPGSTVPGEEYTKSRSSAIDKIVGGRLPGNDSSSRRKAKAVLTGYAR
jgi:hypothetical protein